MTSAAPTVTTGAVRRSLQRSGFDWRGAIFQAILLLCLLFSLAVLAILLSDVLSKGLGVLTTRGLDFLTSDLSQNAARAGVHQGIVGSVIIALVVTVFAFPVGIMTAVYLEEYAEDNRLTRFISLNIRNLAGVPSVVYGLLGLAIFVGLFKTLGMNGNNVIAGGLTMAVLVLPIVIITSAEALRAVPHAIREAGYGVGASRWEVTSRLVLPAAVPGILTGTVLSLSRALGETAPLILVGAIFGYFSSGSQSGLQQLLGSFTALPMIVFGWARNAQSAFKEGNAAAAIIILLLVTLIANSLAIVLRNRFERTW